jgi:hypothetical protein
VRTDVDGVVCEYPSQGTWNFGSLVFSSEFCSGNIAAVRADDSLTCFELQTAADCQGTSVQTNYRTWSVSSHEKLTGTRQSRRSKARLALRMMMLLHFFVHHQHSASLSAWYTAHHGCMLRIVLTPCAFCDKKHAIYKDITMMHCHTIPPCSKRMCKIVHHMQHIHSPLTHKYMCAYTHMHACIHTYISFSPYIWAKSFCPTCTQKTTERHTMCVHRHARPWMYACASESAWISSLLCYAEWMKMTSCICIACTCQHAYAQ